MNNPPPPPPNHFFKLLANLSCPNFLPMGILVIEVKDMGINCGLYSITVGTVKKNTFARLLGCLVEKCTLDMAQDVKSCKLVAHLWKRDYHEISGWSTGHYWSDLS